ncbi:deoxyribodipyrimidine photolyase [Buchnera aphidicola (Schlechtendalia chinensis)]|uniref:Deoxyribodipyrimidine photo-lyase n=1 Tax=Buchnera aphidicola subsp. Schlechtendalia chinensis TaxID=118110 RepID=A0A172WDP2_BUCSC|nr:deoxyribodipyrimidine photo-lyase [Buchnera aphidicola]ANF17057.1 deoxyribodipyrimidine photolyase [Buchnera aphidicola (Schlechtendalia chinensis)]
MTINLVWFRNDLRIRNNLALASACKNRKSVVLALFISVLEQWKTNLISDRKAILIHEHVISLRKELMKLNIFLHYCKSSTFLKSIDCLITFCKKNKVQKLYYNYEYEFFEKKRDNIVAKRLKKNFILSKGFHNSTLFEPGSIVNKKGEMYKKYSHFKKKCIMSLSENNFNEYSIPKKRKIFVKKNNFKISLLQFPIKKFYKQLFPIGEKKILKKLKLFLKNKIQSYNINRNCLSLNSTSMISAYLSIGVLSPIQCLSIFLKYHSNINTYTVGTCNWINELIWREFFKHLLYFYPLLSKNQVLCNWEKRIQWKNNEKHFHAWKNGRTGFPIIDAGMRQLNKIGWIHNRIRMITASFLVKNLLINWRNGEKYFISQLIDGDLALNNGNWQWIASIGNDSAPYFRIFNPIVQSKKFDNMGIFIKKYVPELKKVPISIIHDPHLWSNSIKATIKYPEPIVNLISSRKIAIKIFKLAKFTS